MTSRRTSPRCSNASTPRANTAPASSAGTLTRHRRSTSSRTPDPPAILHPRPCRSGFSRSCKGNNNAERFADNARTPARNRPVLRSLIDLKPRGVPFRVALRYTIAVVAPLAVGLAIDQVPAGLAMTIGAINTLFTDQPGPSRQRIQHMLMASTVAGFSALVGILVGGPPWLFVLAAALAGLFGGLRWALGPVVARGGFARMS